MRKRRILNPARLSTGLLLCLGLAAASIAPLQSAHAQPVPAGEARGVDLDIPAGSLADALDRFSEQAGLQLISAQPVPAGIKVPALKGRFTVAQALERLTARTDLAWELTDAGNVVLRRKPAAPRASRPPQASASSEEERVVGMPAIMVQGARTLNMDITRTREDPQPYVVFDRDLIERSGATSIEQLLQQKLPMNTSAASMGAGANLSNNGSGSSEINLRGLGSGQTLILVDGHRMSSPSVWGDSTQGEISGIPLAAVERIEILPSTASGIYGGSATGGVINIITRKDYSGGELRMTYDNTFSTDSAVRKIDFVFGHNFNQGKTNLLLSAGYSDANTLVEADRGFVSRGHAHMREHNPDYYLDWANIPVGRRPNFASVDGSDLVLKSGAALGSPYGSVPANYGGVATDGGAGLQATAGQHDASLQDGSGGLGRDLYVEPRVKNAGLVLRHRFNEGLQAFVDFSTSESQRRHSEILPWGIEFSLPVDSPYNPFTTAIQGRLLVPHQASNWTMTKRDRAVVGVIKQLPADWQMSLDHTWDRTRLNFMVAPRSFTGDLDGLDLLRDLNAFPLDLDLQPSIADAPSQMTMKNTNLRFSGPLGDLPGGRPVLSAALSHRAESAPGMWMDRPAGQDMLYFPYGAVSVSSAYMEYRVPLFSGLNARPGFRELDLQVAARYENYISRSGGAFESFPRGERPPSPPELSGVRNEFSSVDPTVALRWKPIEDLVLRMSYGTGFQPPALSQLAPWALTFVGSWLSDPRRGNSSVGVFSYVGGGNPDLRPESSKSWSAGFIFTPSYVPGLRVSVDYTRIEKRDNIGDIPGWEQGIIDQEALYPDRVVRGPNLPGDPPGWAGPIIQVDTSVENLARLELEAWDVQLDYRMDTETRGGFDLFLVGTWQPRYAIQAMSGEPMVDYVGMGSTGLGGQYPLEFKANAGLTWSLSAWRAGWNLNYFDGYVVSPDDARLIANQGNGGRVPSQTYHDAFVNYDFALSSASGVPDWLSGTQVQLGIRNLFNKRPPVDMGAGAGHAYYSPFGSPRLASYYLTVTTRF